MKKVVMIGFCGLLVLFSVVSVYGNDVKVSKTAEEGFVSLFSENVLDPQIWQGELNSYKANGNVLIASPGGFVCTKKEYADFILRFEFKLPPAGNNGIGVRCAPKGSPGRTGMEIQILDDSDKQYKGLNATQYNASVYGVVAPSPAPNSPVGQWNSEEIKMVGSKITITVNGVKVIDADLAKITSFPIKGLVPSIHNKSGRIALAGHNSPVEFRNIRILALEN